MKSILFIIWMLLTAVLCISIIGWVAILPHKDIFESTSVIKKSTWMQMGSNLLNSILN